MEGTYLIFCALLCVVAFLYASVGHGGASGYLALMAFFSFAPDTMRSTALILNTAVSLMSFVYYYRAGYFSWQLFWPFALASVPAAFIGGSISLDAGLYKKCLAVFLVFAAFRLFGFKLQLKELRVKRTLILSLFIGACIGLFSGMIGIGGGIILSPLILLLHWADMKQTAALSALFIFVNSLAGLAGLSLNLFGTSQETLILLCIALGGGIAGSYFGAKKFEMGALKKVLGCVLLIASLKLFFT